MSKQFKVECLSCGACYADGTLLLISRIGGCYKPTTYPFWKEPKDVTNRVSTRSQLKKKCCVARSYVIENSNLLQNRMAKYLNEVVAADAEVDPDSSNNSSSDSDSSNSD